ncbi:MAG: MFS transporter [Anaerolineae bacterium]|nr:MFS transporter [Anaerolineae bacterium]
MASMAQAPAAESKPARVHNFSAFQFPNFRLYFIGQTISISGSWMQIVAQGWLVFELTKNELWLGLVACAAGLPSLILSPLAGVLVERIHTRKLLLITQTMQMFLALALALLTFSNTVQVWHIMVLAFLLGITNAIDAPSRQAIVADLVDREHLPSGIAMNSIIFNLSRVIGPVIGGILLTKVGPAWCFLINGLSFIAVLFTLYKMQVAIRPRTLMAFAPIKQLKEGLQFARKHHTIAPLLLLAVAAALFTNNISTLLPAFADTVLHSPKEAYADITTAIGVGAVIAGLIMNLMGKWLGRGRVVGLMVIFVTISAFAFSTTATETPAIIFAGLYGFGIILQFVTVNTLIQSEVPDAFRGRVLSLYTLSWFGIAPFGALLMGGVASVIGTPTTIGLTAVLGGMMSIFVLLRWPAARQLA